MSEQELGDAVPARAASLRPQPPAASSQSGIPIARKPLHGGYPDAVKAPGPIILEMARAQENHEQFERRLIFLLDWYHGEEGSPKSFVDRDGEWGTLDVLRYAAEVCGVSASGTPTQSAETGTGSVPEGDGGPVPEGQTPNP